MIILVIGLFSFLCCYHNDSELNDYKKQVQETYYKIHHKRINIKTDITFNYSKTKDAAGICYLKENKIYINKSKWWELSDIQRFALISHEIGHCHFKLLHSKSNNLMNTNLLSLKVDEKMINDFYKSLK